MTGTQSQEELGSLFSKLFFVEQMYDVTAGSVLLKLISCKNFRISFHTYFKLYRK